MTTSKATNDINASVIRVERYQDAFRGEWNDFLRKSKNGTFLFDRGYVEYHRDRFRDHSLVIRQQDQIVALMCAHEQDGEVYSHRGLSYGGMVLSNASGIQLGIAAFRAAADHFRAVGFRALNYQKVPSYYCAVGSDEDVYALHQLGATMTDVRPCFVIEPDRKLPYQKRRLRGINRAIAKGCHVERSTEFSRFWQEILVPTLNERHGARPVHSVEEIHALAANFPDNIRLYTVTAEGALLAGAVIYLSEGAAHLQYIAGTPEGRTEGACDLLIHEIANRRHFDLRYFSLGTSLEPDTGELNSGLVEWKEGFGARAWSHYVFRLPLDQKG